MAAELTSTDPYSAYCRTTVVEAAPERSVVEQPPDPEVDNHVKVRHASALYAAAYEAARQLVLTALGERAAAADVRLADSEIAYKQVGLGVVTSTAVPDGPGWDTLAADLDAAKPVELACTVESVDPGGKTVVTLGTRWAISRRR
jgi:hypothetical protein